MQIVFFHRFFLTKITDHLKQAGDFYHHTLDFEGFLYDQTLTVELKHFFRQEWAFAGVAPLKERIALDIKEIRDWFSEKGL